MNTRTSIIIAFTSMLIMLVLYMLTSLGYMGPNPVGQGTSYNEPLVVPAGYAFAIWSVIYLAMIAFPILHWFRIEDKTHAHWNEIRGLYTVNIIANGLWLVCASYSWQILTVAIIVIMLITLYRINVLLVRLRTTRVSTHFWIEDLGFSLYFGWITLATALNISAALAFYEFDGFGIPEMTWAIGFFIVVPIVAGLVFWKFKDRAYAAVVVWAFIAIAVKNWGLHPTLAYLAIAVILAFLWLIFKFGKSFDSDPIKA